MEVDEKVTEEGYRLAPYLLRVASTAIDGALCLAGLLALYYLSFPNGQYGTIGDAMGLAQDTASLAVYQKACGLEVVDENGSLSDLASSSYEDYEAAIKYYYFVYNDPANEINPNPENYSVAYYNFAVLGLPDDVAKINTSTYYDFAQDASGNPLQNEFGVLKQSLYEEGTLTVSSKTALLTYYQTQYGYTQDRLLAEPYYKSLADAAAGKAETLEMIDVFVPFLIFYFILPMFSPYSRTLGKKWMHLAVIDSQGTPLAKWRLILRSLPFLLSLGAAIFLNDLIISTTLLVVVFLISMGLASFTPKRRALHDYTAHSVVVREEDAFPKVTASSAEAGEADPHA
jgi:hypothetical protein